jgi:hypothetical protein
LEEEDRISQFHKAKHQYHQKERERERKKEKRGEKEQRFTYISKNQQRNPQKGRESLSFPEPGRLFLYF